MTKINQIQQAIIALSPGAYQKLMDEYLIKRFNFDNYTPYGSHSGTDKTTPGTPDSYVNCANGKIRVGIVQSRTGDDEFRSRRNSRFGG